jgi:hypothetical protein
MSKAPTDLGRDSGALHRPKKRASDNAKERDALAGNGAMRLSSRTRAVCCFLVVSIFLVAFAVDIYDDNILNNNPDDDFMNMDAVMSFILIVYFCASEITFLSAAHFIPMLPSLLIGFLMLRAPPAEKLLIRIEIKARGMRQLPYSPCFFIAN